MKHKGESPQTLLEIILVMSLSLLLFFFVPSFSWTLYFLPLMYVLIERRIRKRKWQEIGFKSADLLRDLRANWHLFLLVVIVIQPSVIVGSRFWWPELFGQFTTRVEFLLDLYGQVAPLATFFLLIAIAALLEEIIYRGFVQERIGWFTKDGIAIFAASLLMGIAHLTSGEPIAMFADILLVILDSIIYGLIYMRSRNVVVAWAAHLAADYVGLTLILLCIIA